MYIYATMFHQSIIFYDYGDFIVPTSNRYLNPIPDRGPLLRSV